MRRFRLVLALILGALPAFADTMYSSAYEDFEADASVLGIPLLGYDFVGLTLPAASVSDVGGSGVSFASTSGGSLSLLGTDDLLGTAGFRMDITLAAEVRAFGFNFTAYNGSTHALTTTSRQFCISDTSTLPATCEFDPLTTSGFWGIVSDAEITDTIEFWILNTVEPRVPVITSFFAGAAAETPESGTLALFGGGLIMVALVRRKQAGGK